MAATKSTKRHTSRTERQQARERAQERAQAALDRLDEGICTVYNSERWESWLRSLSKFYDYRGRPAGRLLLSGAWGSVTADSGTVTDAAAVSAADGPHMPRKRATPKR